MSPRSHRLLVAAAASAIAATAAVACRGPLSAQPRPSADRPVVLLLHGRGVSGRDTAALRSEWQAALERGVREADAGTSVPFFRPGDVRLVWYADALDPMSDAVCPVATADPAPGPRASEMAAAALTFITTLAGSAAAGDEPARAEVRGLAGDILFFADRHRRCAAERRVADAIAQAAIEGRPVILVAHSFGSLVGYRYLLGDGAAAGPVERYVTLGSPLANPFMRLALFGGDRARPLALPEGVRSWVNVRDPGDPIAVSLGQLASEHDAVQDVLKTERGSGAGVHEVSSYLRDAATGRAVLEAWRAVTR